MSTLIRLQFSPCYLDSEIPESCRGGGYISQLQDVVGLGNLDYCLMSQKTIAKRSFITFILVKHTTQFLVLYCIQCQANVLNSHAVNFIHKKASPAFIFFQADNYWCVGICLDRSYFTPNTISSYPIALSCSYILGNSSDFQVQRTKHD